MKASNERVLCGSGSVGRIVCTSLTDATEETKSKQDGGKMVPEASLADKLCW